MALTCTQCHLVCMQHMAVLDQGRIEPYVGNTHHKPLIGMIPLISNLQRTSVKMLEVEKHPGD